MLQEKLVERLLCPRVRTARQKVKSWMCGEKCVRARSFEVHQKIIRTSATKKNNGWELSVNSVDVITAFLRRCFLARFLCCHILLPKQIYVQFYQQLVFQLRFFLPVVCVNMRVCIYECDPHPEGAVGNARDKLWQPMRTLAVCLACVFYWVKRAFSGLLNVASVWAWMLSTGRRVCIYIYTCQHVVLRGKDDALPDAAEAKDTVRHSERLVSRGPLCACERCSGKSKEAGYSQPPLEECCARVFPCSCRFSLCCGHFIAADAVTSSLSSY